jgi:GH24 family phage-related lysozyme (muramidase)
MVVDTETIRTRATWDGYFDCHDAEFAREFDAWLEAHDREVRQTPITDEQVAAATSAAYMAGLGAYQNMVALEPKIRAALEAARGAS